MILGPIGPLLTLGPIGPVAACWLPMTSPPSSETQLVLELDSVRGPIRRDLGLSLLHLGLLFLFATKI
jgi:hypothetical protein